jgi:hypothetical protein
MQLCMLSWFQPFHGAAAAVEVRFCCIYLFPFAWCKLLRHQIKEFWYRCRVWPSDVSHIDTDLMVSGCCKHYIIARMRDVKVEMRVHCWLRRGQKRFLRFCARQLNRVVWYIQHFHACLAYQEPPSHRQLGIIFEVEPAREQQVYNR